MRYIIYAIILFLTIIMLRGDAAPAQIPVTVTAYSHTGHLTASGLKPRPGYVAVSHDLKRHFAWGQRIHLLGSTYQIQDLTARRFRSRVDIFLPTRQAARQFGLKHTQLTPLP